MKKNNKRRDSRYNNKKEKEKGKKSKKSSEDKYQGLNSLSQVVGAPKSHSFHSSIPVPPSKTVKEPLHICKDCGERIQSIAEAFSIGEGEYIHFDCMLERIKKSENIKDGQSLSYVGKGNFAIFEKDAEGKYVTIKTIPVEDEKKNAQMKEYVEALKI